MSVVIFVCLPKFTAQRLEELARVTQLSKTDLIVQGLETIFAYEHDRKITYLTDEQFDEVQNFLDKPISEDNRSQLNKTMKTPYPW